MAVGGVNAEAPASQASIADMPTKVEAPQVDAPIAPLEVAETPMLEPISTPAAFGEDLDGVREEALQATAELQAPETVMAVAQEAETPLKADEVGEAVEVAEVAEVAEIEAAPEVAEAPKVSAPQAVIVEEAVASAPAQAPVQVSVQAEVQTTMQTTMNTGPSMSAGSYDQDQLDIPAFLRR